jgi:hypothetical protein
LKSNEDESDENYYEPLVDRTSSISSRKNSIEPWTRRRSTSTSTNERGNYYSTYDINIKK